jgi:hypothetical protein
VRPSGALVFKKKILGIVFDGILAILEHQKKFWEDSMEELKK